MSSPGETVFYVLAIVLGLGAGALDVMIGDLLLTALFVLASTMLLGAMRPARPWRWVLAVGVFVPAAHLLAYLITQRRPYLAQIYESCLGFLTGIAGAYGGALGRRAVDEVMRKG